jgi:predicted acyl esterase
MAAGTDDLAEVVSRCGGHEPERDPTGRGPFRRPSGVERWPQFSTHPFAIETEITGPVMARLFVSSSTTHLDLFATLRLLDPAGDEVVFTGAHEATPVTRGWAARLSPQARS